MLEIVLDCKASATVHAGIVAIAHSLCWPLDRYSWKMQRKSKIGKYTLAFCLLIPSSTNHSFQLLNSYFNLDTFNSQ